MDTHLTRAGLVGPYAPQILRLAGAPDADGLRRKAELGFDTLLCHGPVPASVVVPPDLTVLADLRIDRADADAPEALFKSLPVPSLDPRADTAFASERSLALRGEAPDADLAAFWAERIAALSAAGFAGVRLLGLDALPAAILPGFLTGLRALCPDAILFGWTPGLPWSTLEALPPRCLDLVASSLPWWDGRGDWLWRELDALSRVATVVADAGDAASVARRQLAAVMSPGWMTADPADLGLSRARSKAAHGCTFTRLLSGPSERVVAFQLSDQPDPRRAGRTAVALVNLSDEPQSVAAAPLLARLGADFVRLADPDGAPLHPATAVQVAPLTTRIFAGLAAASAPETPLAKRSATAAAAQARIAIENPAPAVDGGRFPARRTVGSLVRIECDLIADGHERLAASVRYRGPGDAAWTEVDMAPGMNDRWFADIPLDRLGLAHYTIEAWKDVWAYFVYELEAKHKAGLNTSLEIREGVALVEAAAKRSPASLRKSLEAVLKGLTTDDQKRPALLAAETAALMHAADERPHRVALERPIPLQAERTAAGFASWYEVFPRSMSDDPNRHGTFRDVVRHLPRVRAMGFDVLYFPPIHPIGSKNKKGRNNTLTPGPDDVGSPYAIGSAEGGHTDVHPELGTLEDFEHLRAEAAAQGIELALDFAIQCSPDHPWLKQHPDWFNWRPDGSIRYAENPPKKYEDIVNVDFYTPGAMPGLWLALADAVMFWARNGVRLFRVDNPHTKAFPFWEWMIAEVQARYPDTVFLAEAFTRPKVMYRLAKVGFSQSYTYFTWRTQKWEFREYMLELTQGPAADFFRPHFFVNTPDINPLMLHTSGRPGFLIRAALAATLAGLWGVYSGFELCEGTPLVAGKEEYLDSEKYEIKAWDWDRPGNIVAEISALNAIRKLNPALQTHLGITFLDCPNEQMLVYEKATPDRSNVVLIAVSLDPANTQSGPVSIPFWRYDPEPPTLEATDLLGGGTARWHERQRNVTLSPDRPYAIWRLSRNA